MRKSLRRENNSNLLLRATSGPMTHYSYAVQRPYQYTQLTGAGRLAEVRG